MFALDSSEVVRAWAGIDPRLSAHTREKLTQDDSEVVHAAIAFDPRTPLHLVLSLARDPSKTVRSAVAGHPDTPIALVEALIDDFEEAHFGYLECRRDLTPKILDRISKSHKSLTRRTAADNPLTPYECLKILAQDEDIGVRRKLSKNPACDVAIFKILLQSDFEGESQKYLSWAIAQNPNLSAAQIEEMGRSQHLWVRHEAAKHPLVSQTLLIELAEDPEYEVRNGAARNLKTHPDILRRLATEPDTDNSIRVSVAGNPSTPVDVLEDMAGLNEGWRFPDQIHWALRANPSSTARVRTSIEQNREAAYDRQLAAFHAQYPK